MSTVVKILIVGDETVEKTSILAQYKEGTFMTEEYRATFLEHNLITINYNGQSYPVELIDSEGQEDFKTIRERFYPEADVFLLCYDVTNQTSAHNIESKVCA